MAGFWLRPRQSSSVQARFEARPRHRGGQALGRSRGWNFEQYLEAGGPQGNAVMRYAVVIEKAETNYSAYVPDLPGCVATGSSVKEVEKEIRDAIRFHIEGLKEDGLPVFAPSSIAEYAEA
jgi:predicted RNase H-like HicB family nuclease